MPSAFTVPPSPATAPTLARPLPSAEAPVNPWVLDGTYKGFPLAAPPCPATDIAQRGYRVLAGDLPLPLAVLSRSALMHNLAWMRDYTLRKGVSLAPHGKTTMSPELFALQLQAGAWGLTFANAFQAAVGVAAGVRRIVIANQVVGDADLDALDALRAEHADLQLWFLVDSQAQLALIEDWAVRRGVSRRFDVLLELGMPGQRTGCRSEDGAVDLARAIAGSAAVQLAGLECYEGGLWRCDTAHDVPAVTELLRRVVAVARHCDMPALWSGDEILLSAGGSAVFDLVIPLLQMQGLSRPVRGVLRSGCYLTHDHGNYARYLLQVEQREALASSLRPALTVWALVQSVPEPGLALLNAGRRDMSFDIDLPVPVQWAPRGQATAQQAPAHWGVFALNDQHAYLRFDPEQTVPQVGDRVALGISHPCTTFDKWRWMPIVEDDGAVTGAIHTCF